MKESGLLEQLIPSVVHDLHEFQYGNTDSWRFPEGTAERVKRGLKDRALDWANRHGFTRKEEAATQIGERLLGVVRDGEALENFYRRLQDDYSRRLPVEVLKFRILGARHARLPLNNEQYWQARADVDRRYLRERSTLKSSVWDLHFYQLDEAHGRIGMHGSPLGILCTFLLGQYSYRHSQPPVEAEPGDVVIDGGGCWGDTALYFAHKAGPEGRVLSFEFVPDNLAIFRRNLECNPALASRVEIVEHPLWERAGDELIFNFNGPSTTIVEAGSAGAVAVETATIDDVVERKNLERVDFIKMDIEGAEQAALRGAERTIRKFQPKLAISVYHKDEDFFMIPNYLDSLGVRYEFFLDHFTIYREETVLFARPAAAD